MKWYFWLNQIYNKIIYQYQNGYYHNSILLNSTSNLGSDSLIWGIARWLLCNNPIGVKSCNLCTGCQLMKVNTHPDWYQFENKKEENIINILFSLKEKIYQSSQQGGVKVISFLNINQFTKCSINTLLKIIEEPPKNSCFFFSCDNFLTVPMTLKSRCIILHLLPPVEQQGFLWLKKQVLNSDNQILSALRLNNGSPISALTLLTSNDFYYRNNLCNKLLVSLLKHQMIELLPIINNDSSINCINWLIFLITDAIKLQNKCSLKWIINCDFINLIKILSNKITKNGLLKLMYKWLFCRNNLIYSLNINKEILIINNLLLWEKLILTN